MYRVEHEELFASIREGKPINNGHYMCNSTMIGILGRQAAYTGATVTWDECLKNDERLGPTEYAWGDVLRSRVRRFPERRWRERHYADSFTMIAGSNSMNGGRRRALLHQHRHGRFVLHVGRAALAPRGRAAPFTILWMNSSFATTGGTITSGTRSMSPIVRLNSFSRMPIS